MTYAPSVCAVFWGSHGCDKPNGHVMEGDLIHQCGGLCTCCDPEEDLCSQFIVLAPKDANTEITGAVRYSQGEWQGKHEGWSEWVPSRWFS